MLPESYEELDKLAEDPTGSICWSCHMFESFCGQEPFMVCFECGHVYHTSEQLVREYEIGIDWAWEGPAHEVPFCAACLHNF